MIFGFLEDVVKVTTKTAEDALDVTTSILTLGEYGELSEENVSRLLSRGMTIVEISAATGVGVDVLAELMSDD